MLFSLANFDRGSLSLKLTPLAGNSDLMAAGVSSIQRTLSADFPLADLKSLALAAYSALTQISPSVFSYRSITYLWQRRTILYSNRRDFLDSCATRHPLSSIVSRDLAQ